MKNLYLISDQFFMMALIRLNLLADQLCLLPCPVLKARRFHGCLKVKAIFWIGKLIFITLNEVSGTILHRRLNWDLISVAGEPSQTNRRHLGSFRRSILSPFTFKSEINIRYTGILHYILFHLARSEFSPNIFNLLRALKTNTNNTPFTIYPDKH